ncbi:MAG: sensor domain-containing diguanylate cyclase [Desulfobacteraceae bacterium]|nr:MAG: sensor domain-containing diguanylate cyclase [Desulfobacteraceae bacterium]
MQTLNRHDETPSLKETVFYNPQYQFIIRLLLGGLTGVYFYLAPVPFFIPSGETIVCLTIGAYILFHILWWRYFRSKGISHLAMRLANWIDFIGAGLSVLVDPYPMPPTIVLILITVIGNGIQHGLKNFMRVAQNAFFICLVVIPIHFVIIQRPPPYPFYFLSLFLLILAHYAFDLVKRIERLKDRAEKLAQHDELTGLMNRRAFLKSADYLISLYNRTHIPLVFVFADLDDFKKVNDSMGHDVGDQVLKQIGVLAANHFRNTDITARYGGDEFVFILTDSHLEDAKNVISRFEEQFAGWAKNSGIPVGVSFGIIEATGEKVILDALMKTVDEALYTEKKRKKGRAGTGAS